MTQWTEMLENIQREYFTHPNDFLRQPTISRTIHPRQPNLADRYVDYLKRDTLAANTIDLIADSKVGAPHTTCCNGKLSLTSIQNAYYLHHMRNLFHGDVIQNVDCVVDVGGGYGNMARVFDILGFDGSYTIIDFPIMHSIQRWFLQENDVKNVKLKTLKQTSFNDISDNSLLLATFSMNEMPNEDRQVIKDNILKFKYVFIAHNRNFDGIDNISYFNNLKEEISDTFKIQQFVCPVNQTHRYFVGKKHE